MKGMTKGRYKVNVSTWRQNAADFAQNPFGITDVFQNRITFHPLKSIRREWQLLRIRNHVDTGNRKQVDVDVALNRTARTTDIQVPPAKGEVRGLGWIHHEGVRRM